MLGALLANAAAVLVTTVLAMFVAARVCATALAVLASTAVAVRADIRAIHAAADCACVAVFALAVALFCPGLAAVLLASGLLFKSVLLPGATACFVRLGFAAASRCAARAATSRGPVRAVALICNAVGRLFCFVSLLAPAGVLTAFAAAAVTRVATSVLFTLASTRLLALRALYLFTVAPLA